MCLVNLFVFLTCLIAKLLQIENGGHFRRHLGFRKELRGDFRELLVCYSTHVPGPILKNSACYELCPAYN